MGTKTSVRLSIDLLPDFHEELQALAEASGKTVKKYVVETLESRVQKDNELEDRILGELVEEAVKEGYIGVEESEELSTLIRNA